MRRSLSLRTPCLPVIIGIALLTVSCRGAVAGLDTDPTRALATTDGVFGGVSTRFHNVEREPKVRTARRLIVSNVMTPSRVFKDTAAWSARPSPTSREMVWRAVAEPGRLRFTNDQPGPLTRAGETRHTFRLQSLGDNEYEWVEHADVALGASDPDAIAAMVTAWLASGERADAGAVRADLHAAFARSANEWGRVFSFDRAESRRDTSGAWIQRHTFTMHATRTAITFPKLAKWLRDYISPLRIHVRLRDSNRTWFDATVRNDSLVVRVRTRGGHLLPLEGGDIALPDTVTLDADFSAKFSFFRVGFKALRAQFVFISRENGSRGHGAEGNTATRADNSNEVGWSLRFVSEPDWQLPFLTEQMLRTPLRRPFAGAGSSFRLTVSRDSSSAQTLLARHAVVPVQESAILRFLARLANSGVNAYVDGAEREMGQWLSASFGALRDDSRAIIASR